MVNTKFLRSMSGTASPPVAYATSAVVHWFRRDLRLHDNLSLNAALRVSATRNLRFLPVYVFDAKSHTCVNSGANRWRFLHDSVSALRARVLKTFKTDLLVLHGQALEVLPALCNRVGVSELHFELDPAPPGVAADDAVIDALEKLSVAVHRWEGHTMYAPQKLLLKSAGGVAPRTMSAFLGTVQRAGPPDAPTALAPERGLPHNVPCPPTPTLADLGVSVDGLPPMLLPGGEEAALRRMLRFIAREQGRVAAQFSKPETSPATFGSNRDTTILSPYLAHGCLSSRMFYSKLVAVERRFKPASMVQTRLTGQMLWREHFWLLARTTNDFHNESGHLCRAIPWDKDSEADERLATWREARTGYPWIDALMTQLRTEGFVHHLGRHSLACFLTRGDLWVSWTRGAAVFDEMLLDFDYALNAANWMWLSCSAFFNSYFRVYSPIAFARKWDKNGAFIRHYLPALRRMPDKYIHEPWRAPRAVQITAGCVIGKDYPKPVVDHGIVSKVNIGKMRIAFQQNAAMKHATNANNTSMVDKVKSRKRARESLSGEESNRRGKRAR